MKNTSLRLFAFLLLAAFALTGTPSFASTLSTSGTENAQWQSVQNSLSGKQDFKLEKKSEKRGFFAKAKTFGQKTKLFFKTAGAMVAGGDHNAVVAILLAFFLGGLALHRVYLGGSPVLILLYLITFGGIFGLLPLIDFIRLILGQMDHYENNNSFFAAFS